MLDKISFANIFSQSVVCLFILLTVSFTEQKILILMKSSLSVLSFIDLASNRFFFWLRRVACGILVPPPGLEPVPPAVEARNLNHWTLREVPRFLFNLSVFPSCS